MLSRELIATVIKTFFEELEEVRDGGGHVSGESYAGFYTAYFNKERDWFLQTSVPEIASFLADDPIHKLEMLVELMFRDARAMSDFNMQRIVCQKVLELYEVIDFRSHEFSLERMNKSSEIKKMLG